MYIEILKLMPNKLGEYDEIKISKTVKVAGKGLAKICLLPRSSNSRWQHLSYSMHQSKHVFSLLTVVLGATCTNQYSCSGML